MDESRALDILHHASVYLGASFDMRMDRTAAQSNLEARAILFRCANRIFSDHGCPVSREEIEGAAILERELGE